MYLVYYNYLNAGPECQASDPSSKVHLLTWQTRSRFVWANGRAARIGRAIPVCLIGRLPILEVLPSLPLDIWPSRQRFRNKMAETANEKRVYE